MDKFYNSTHSSRTETGLEISTSAVVDVEYNTAYNLSTRQTPTLEDIREQLGSQSENDNADESRVDWYVNHLKLDYKSLPFEVKYLVTDGYYTKKNLLMGYGNVIFIKLVNFNFAKWCKDNRHKKANMIFNEVNAKLRGYYNYYGVSGNSESLSAFFYYAKRNLFKWLNRRSQRKSYNWQGFNDLMERFGREKPRIVVNPIQFVLCF